MHIKIYFDNALYLSSLWSNLSMSSLAQIGPQGAEKEDSF